MEEREMVAVSQPIPAVKEAGEQVKRFDAHQRIQHFALMSSFIVLVATGVPLKFSGSPVSQWWVAFWGGIDVTRSIHFGAAWVMIADGVYHLIYILFSTLVLKRPFPVKMLPALVDFRQFIQEIGYFVGVTKNKPGFDRFSWREKFDYFAIFWGVPVMALSGLIMMFPVLVSKILPSWIIPAALVAHSDEAMLALIWIFMVHVFFAHFSPGSAPFNTVIFTGKMSTHRYRNEHPVEYQKLFSPAPVQPVVVAEDLEGGDEADKIEKLPPDK
jgi:formate dehydrogenase subunit gamma